FLEGDPIPLIPTRSAAWNRGAYLVLAVAHCGECHTPRNLMGAMSQREFLDGNPDGPEGKKVPNLAPGGKGAGSWDDSDLVTYLKTGMTPDGDFAAGLMAEV